MQRIEVIKNTATADYWLQRIPCQPIGGKVSMVYDICDAHQLLANINDFIDKKIGKSMFTVIIKANFINS